MTAKINDICPIGHSGLICCSYGTSLRIYRLVENKLDEIFAIKKMKIKKNYLINVIV